MASKSDNSGTIVLVLICILIVGIIIAVKYEAKIFGENNPLNGEEVEPYIMTLKVQDTSNKGINATYVLKDTFIDVLKGDFKPQIIEQFLEAKPNVSYSFIAYEDDNISEDYYLNKITCLDEPNCIITLEKEASVVFKNLDINSNTQKIIIRAENGIIKNPILCIAHTPNFYDFELPYTNRDVPLRFKYKADKCYEFGNSITTGETSFDLKFKDDGTYPESAIKLTLVDEGFDENYNPSYEVDNQIEDMVILINN